MPGGRWCQGLAYHSGLQDVPPGGCWPPPASLPTTPLLGPWRQLLPSPLVWRPQETAAEFQWAKVGTGAQSVGGSEGSQCCPLSQMTAFDIQRAGGKGFSGALRQGLRSCRDSQEEGRDACRRVSASGLPPQCERRPGTQSWPMRSLQASLASKGPGPRRLEEGQSRGKEEQAGGHLRSLEGARVIQGLWGLPGGAAPRLADLCGAVGSSKVVDGPGAPRPCGLLRKGRKQLIKQ